MEEQFWPKSRSESLGLWGILSFAIAMAACSSSPSIQGTPLPDASASANECVDDIKLTESFESGWASNWYLGPGVGIVDDTGKVLKASSDKGTLAAYLSGDPWRDYVLSFKLKLESGEARASVRRNTEGLDLAYDEFRGQVRSRYYMSFKTDSVIIGKTTSDHDVEMASAKVALTAGQWHTATLSLSGGKLSVSIDGEIAVEAVDSDPIASGSFALETVANAVASFDDVSVVGKLSCASTWSLTKASPLGADINVLAVDPVNSQVIYAGTEHAGFYQSTNAGVSWDETGYSGDMGRLGKTHAIAIAPSDPKVVYAGWGSADIGRSDDGGLHWVRTGLSGAYQMIQSLAVSPSDAKTVYAALGDGGPGAPVNGIFKSEDAGDTWRRLDVDAPTFALSIAKASPETLFAVASNGIYKTTNAGGSWTKVRELSFDAYAVRAAIAVHPTDSNLVYAAVGKTLKSIDAGKTWLEVKNNGIGVALSESDPKTVFVLDRAALFKSADAGQNWISLPRVTDKPHDLSSFAIDPRDSNNLYAGTGGQGVFYSNDSGTTWRPPNLMRAPADLGACVAVHPKDSAQLYVGTVRGEVYRTRDRGGDWTRLATVGVGGPMSSITGIVIDPLNTQTVFSSTLEGVFRSSDEGATWTKRTNGLTDTRVVSLAIDAKNPQRLFAGTGNSRPRNMTEGSGVFYTTNGGEAWVHPSDVPNKPVSAIAISPSDPRITYVATMGAGVFRTIDEGATWSEINSGLQSLCAYTLAVDPTNANIAYVGTNISYCGPAQTGAPDHVYRTDNGGATWRVVLPGLGSFDNVDSIAVSPANHDELFVTYHTEKVFHSENGGSSWTLANEGIIRHGAHLYLWAIAPDNDGSHWYIATCGHGVLRNNARELERMP